MVSVLVVFVVSLVWIFSVSNDVVATQIYTIDVVNEYHHDPGAFSQGLIYAGNDTLYESTGLYKKSSVRKVHLQTGKIEVFHKMGDSWFGEGMTLLGDRLFQVTWLNKKGYIYDQNNLSQIGSFQHQMKDGWGLATDGKVLFGSDGTSSLYAINPVNFEVIKRVTVKYEDREVHYLNELEYINGEVWANVWVTDCIARISPKDGRVLSWVFLPQLRQHLLTSGHTKIDVLNGIAWDEENKRIFVTGKLWPKLYEIKLRPITEQLNKNTMDMCSPPKIIHRM
ncbi:Glutaminyl-peptide cyclotransferase [Zostera marina]|uniref:Glutaminyl-peptide cyclotransferase n=1 Tax=Zostera marina TaxID=29655 RepID=A0A0K9PKI2_ZOSMR|nr:Glutaminyl-peptide cyclotransferase [Zostera marina]